MGEGLVPCSIGYVVWFRGIIWQREFFEALGLCDWVVEYVLESTGCIAVCVILCLGLCLGWLGWVIGGIELVELGSEA